MKSSASKNDITVTTLIDNSVVDDLRSEHGLSLWLEFGDKRILFDTGQTDVIFKNAKLLGIRLDTADAVVLSHGHYDHTGGLKAVLDIASKAILYLNPEALKTRYSHKDKNTRMIGISDSAKEAIHILADSGKVYWTQTPAEILPGLFVTGQIPRNNAFEDTGGNFFTDAACQTPDTLLDDQAIFFESKQGLVILFGCAHAGVVNTLDYVTKLTRQTKVYAIIGGLHLVNANLPRIENTIEAFKKYNIQKIMPLHCTGQNAVEKIKETFDEKCLIGGAGTKSFFKYLID